MIRQDAIIIEIETQRDMLATRCTKLAGDCAELKLSLIHANSERDQAQAEVETLKATLAEREVGKT